MEGFSLQIDNLRNTLPIMGIGYFGVFIVISAIILTTALINKLSAPQNM